MYPIDYKDVYPYRYACSMTKPGKKEQMARKDPLVQKYARDLGANLRRIRKEQGLSQERLGLMIGSRHSRISNIEQGYVAMSVPDLVRLCRALGVDPGELVDFGAFSLADHPEQDDGHAQL